MINILPIQNIEFNTFNTNQDNFLENKQNKNLYLSSDSEKDNFDIIFKQELDNFDER